MLTPMQLDPEHFVFLARHRGVYRWYISERDFWVLDQAAWEQAFVEIGYPSTGGLDDRFGIAVVDRDNADVFLRHMHPYAVDMETLRAATSVDDEPIGPALFVDFDREWIHVGEVESPDFAAYLPPGWRATIGIDPALVPEAARFWEQRP